MRPSHSRTIYRADVLWWDECRSDALKNTDILMVSRWWSWLACQNWDTPIRCSLIQAWSSDQWGIYTIVMCCYYQSCCRPSVKSWASSSFSSRQCPSTRDRNQQSNDDAIDQWRSADVSMPAFGPEEDTFNTHCDSRISQNVIQCN